jgi:hypothetical protein
LFFQSDDEGRRPPVVLFSMFYADSTAAPGVIYRLGRKPDPWAPPDWASAGSDGTFGNRFDDPNATYRVLYASSQRLGCFVETLARFRIDPTLRAELAQIEGADDYRPLGNLVVCTSVVHSG